MKREEGCGDQVEDALGGVSGIAHFGLLADRMRNITPSFGDNVRIRATPLTEKLRFAGLTGQVYGETTPSVTGVEVVGEVTHDFALNVMLEGRGQQVWFAPELVEFVDHAAGTEIRIGSHCFIRDEAGGWSETQSAEPRRKQSFISWLLNGFRRRK